MKTRIIAKAVGMVLLGAWAVCCVRAEFSGGVYSFDSLSEGDLAGQDGWTATRMYSKEGALSVVALDEDDKVLTGTPGKTRYYFRLITESDNVPAFEQGTQCVAIQFDVEAGSNSGTFFSGGEGVGLAVVWDDSLLVRAGGISGKAPLLAEVAPPAVEDGTWVTLRCEVRGTKGRLLWKRADAPDAEFSVLPGGEGFDVGTLLESLPAWDRMGVAIGKAGTMRINNLVPRADCETQTPNGE